jgi:predicted choloylglycine hydrolase
MIASGAWVPFVFEGWNEDAPGPAWRDAFGARWPAYREWFLRGGESARPSYADCVRALWTHMPELMALYERLVDLAGGGDLAARFLSMWDPPPYLSACSQAAWTGGRSGEGPMLVRNYDYAADRFDGVVWSTAWSGRRVLGMSDCAWGLLDGMNETGLTISLAFGGRRVLGHGFGTPLLLRYVLETCDDVAQARAALERVPVNLAYNLTLLDASGAFVTAFVGPDHPPRFVDVACTTNHQDLVEWPEHAEATRSVERQAHMVSLLDHLGAGAGPFADAFLDPPLYSGPGGDSVVTLYTAEYRPREGSARYRWPDSSWERDFGSRASSHRAMIPAAGGAAP